MRDERKWKLGISQFNGIRDNLPAYIPENLVNEYHSALELLASASEEDLSSFRIPGADVKPRVVSFQMATSRHPGRTPYSKDNYCDKNVFKRKLDSLANYLPSIEDTSRTQAQPDDSKDYYSVSNGTLEGLAHRYNIGGYGFNDGSIDRQIIIDALMKRDRAIHVEKPAPRQTINVGNMTCSVIQHGPAHSHATVHFLSAQVRPILNKIRASMDQLPLNDATKGELISEIETVESQLKSPRPKSAIVTECLRSARTILEGAAGSFLSTRLAVEISRILGN
jgi:hypothetical protein